jgi:hypothetical protein
VETDHWAKAYLETARALPRCYQVPYEPWSIWHKGKKMMKLENDIYNMVQGQCAISYWKGKDKIDPALLDYVAWETQCGYKADHTNTSSQNRQLV